MLRYTHYKHIESGITDGRKITSVLTGLVRRGGKAVTKLTYYPLRMLARLRRGLSESYTYDVL